MILLPLLLTAVLAPTDRVRLADGTTASGELRQATLEKVVLRSDGGSDQEFDLDNVLAIEYGNPPELLNQGRLFLKSQDFQNAVNAFDGATTGGGGEWVAMIASLEKAEAQLAWSAIDSGRASDAAASFRDWLAKYTGSYHEVRARTGLARATARSGDVDAGAKLLEELSTLSFEKNLGKHVEFAARLDRCEIYLAGDQAQVAETRLRDLAPKIASELSNPSTPSGMRSRLRKLQTRAQITLGDAIEQKSGIGAAKAYWDGLLRDSRASIDVRAAALIGVAREALDAGRPREAQLKLSQIVATLEPSAEVKARALFRLGEACKALDDDIASSRGYWQQVVDQYPQTSWASRAKEALR